MLTLSLVIAVLGLTALALRMVLVVRSYQRGIAYMDRIVKQLIARIEELEVENKEVVSNINHIAFAPSALGDAHPDIRA